MDASELQKQQVRVHRALRRTPLAFAVLALALAGCTTLPEPILKRYTFPRTAYVGEVKVPFSKLGLVRSKVNFSSLDPIHDEDELCRNYYNKAVRDLVRRARKQKADAVIDVRSVVFYEDGRHELFKTPECSDDGQIGQILVEGIAVKWIPRK